MPRRWKRKDNYNSLEETAFKISAIYVIALIYLWYSKNPQFSTWLIIGIIIFAIILFLVLLKRTSSDLWEQMMSFIKKSKRNGLITELQQAGLEEEVINFIDRFGMGKKSKQSWSYRGYSFEWEQLKDFRNLLIEKGMHLSIDGYKDMNFLLQMYIDQKEANIIRSSVSHNTKKYNELSGNDFENLLYRLFVAMGYVVQITGKTGDQGGDLVANLNGARLLIQAKRYKELVGNAAVQEAVAAQKYYDCNGTMVVTSSNFTNEAFALAKVNNVALVGKERLSELLLQYLNESWH